MNLGASLCRRLNLKELVTNFPVYTTACDVSGGGLSLMFKRWASKKQQDPQRMVEIQNPRILGRRSLVVRYFSLIYNE